MIAVDMTATSPTDVQNGIAAMMDFDRRIPSAASMGDAVPLSSSAPADRRPGPVNATSLRVLDRLGAEGTFTPERVQQARTLLTLLIAWGVRAPTAVSDGSDDDVGLIWRLGDLEASISIDPEEVVAYAYRPNMNSAWTFAKDRIGVAELNRLARIIGV